MFHINTQSYSLKKICVNLKQGSSFTYNNLNASDQKGDQVTPRYHGYWCSMVTIELVLHMTTTGASTVVGFAWLRQTLFCRLYQTRICRAKEFHGYDNA